jgi:hypothetical protein
MPTDLPKAYVSKIISLAKAQSVSARAVDNPKVMRDFRAVCEKLGILDAETNAVRPALKDRDCD